MRGILSWVLLAGFGVVACGSSDEPKSGAEKWYERYGHALCAGVAPCCQAAGEAHDVAGCEQLYGYLGALGVKQAIDGGATFNQAAGEQCLAELATWYDTCTNSGEPESCTKVISGKGAPGASCSFDYDCAQPAVGSEHCTYSSQSDKGTCILTLPPEEGKPCNSAPEDTTLYDCNFSDDYYCDYASDVCKKKVAIGGGCSGSETCVDSAYCDSTSSTCVERIAVGGDCSVLSSACAETAYCDGSVCQALKGEGEPCSGGECLDFCDSTTKTCTAVGSGGYFCVTSS